MLLKLKKHLLNAAVGVDMKCIFIVFQIPHPSCASFKQFMNFNFDFKFFSQCVRSLFRNLIFFFF